MQPDHFLHLSALLTGLQTATARPGSSDLAVRHEETTTVELYRRDDGIPLSDMGDVMRECHIFYDKLVTTVSMTPGWWWQALAKGTMAPLTSWGVYHQFGFPRCAGSATVGMAAGLRIMLHDVNSGQDSRQSGAEAAQLPTKTGNSKMIEARRLRARVAGDLEASESVFESVSAVRSLPYARRGAGAGDTAAVGYSLDIRGLAEEKGGPAADYRLTAFGDGTGHVHFSPRQNETKAGALGKRGGGPGFKITYKVLERGNPDVFPNGQAINIATSGIADDWAKRADEDRDHFGDYVGAIGMGTSGTTVQFRIIPEKGGFGDNYEDVNTCST
ncbi:hypothetical protein PG993_000092 [Apiospora rasikravindrae]|uniref:Uncharacterized protein n=1 Tax=Apiospora rasikravindrae TaxID=990691 RepID=A0ABR1U7L6_9PEZI